jgi:hypothetical protein
MKIKKIKIWNYAMTQDQVNKLYMQESAEGMGFVDWFGIIGWGIIFGIIIIGYIIGE